MKKKPRQAPPRALSLQAVVRALYLIYASGTYCLNNILVAQRRPENDRKFYARLRAEYADLGKKLDLLKEELRI